MKRRRDPDAADAHAALCEVAKQYCGRVSECHIFDPNVCDYITNPEKPWDFVCVSGAPFTRSLSVKHRGLKLAICANDEYMLVKVEGPYREQVSINHPDRICATLVPAEMLSMAARNYPTFVSSERVSLSPALLKKLNGGTLAQLLQVAELGDKGSIHLRADEASVYLALPFAPQRVSRVIEALIGVLPEGKQQACELELSRLPSQFVPLLSLIPTWSVPDDIERQELLTQSPTQSLIVLVEVVEPLLNSIGEYLDSFGGNPPLEACALGTLAECAVEAKALLRKS
jgi:hypothetical protein